MSTESCDQLDLPSTAPESVAAAAAAAAATPETYANDAAGSRRSKRARARSMDAINQATAASKDARIVKKPRGQRPKADTAVDFNCRNEKSGGNKSKDCICEDFSSGDITSDVSEKMSLDNEITILVEKRDSSTQTDCAGCCPICPEPASHKSLADVVSEKMTTFISTVSLDINALRGEVKEMQEAMLQQSVQQSEVDELRRGVQQTSTQLSELRSLLMSSQQNEVQELRKAVQSLSDQQNEVREMRDAVLQAVNQPQSQLSSVTASNSLHNSNQSSCQYPIHSQPVNHYNSEFGDFDDFPSLPPPHKPATSKEHSSATPAPRSSRQTRQSSEQLKQDLMAAMYVDLNSKKRRANNVIITGLQSRETDAKATVCKLLHDEFHWRTAELNEVVLSCRRIGKPRQDGIQPLLITLDSADSASYFIANAKKLRHSKDSGIRANVYISEDLTPSESKAAYEIRRRRREQRNRWQDQSQPQPPESQPVRQASRLVYRSQPQAAYEDTVSTGRVADDSTSMNVDLPAQDTTAASSVASIAANNQSTAQTPAAVGSVPADAVLQSISGRPC